MTAMISRMQLCLVAIFVLVSSVEGFRNRFTQRDARSRFLSMSTGKTPLVANGKRFEADSGSSLIVAVQKLGLRVPTKCKKGECGTCTTTVGGVKIRACVGKVPPAPRLKSLIEKGLVVSVDNA